MNPLRIKICGLTRYEDAKLAFDLGAWTLGFIFYPGSKRFVEASTAASILKNLPQAKAVGVFVNPELSELKRILDEVPLSMIQLHGTESREFCTEVRVLFPKTPIIKARRLEDAVLFDADYTLIDHAEKGEWGGTGITVDWDIIPDLSREKLILAGGINAKNLKEANRIVRPFAFDLSSGVETAPGIKSPEKLKELFEVAKMESSSC